MLVRSQCQTCCFANLALIVCVCVCGGGGGVLVRSQCQTCFANLALIVCAGGGGGGGAGAQSVSDMLFCQLSPHSVCVCV